MDFVGRLPKLEPDLLHEAEIMACQIEGKRDGPGEGVLQRITGSARRLFDE